MSAAGAGPPSRGPRSAAAGGPGPPEPPPPDRDRPGRPRVGGFFIAAAASTVVRVVHEADGTERTLATEVEVADGLLSQGVGLMFRRSVPEDYALVFPFGRAKKRGLHMLCVPFDVDAIWLVDHEVQHVERLSAWIGHGRARAETVLELPGGAAEGVRPGDTVYVDGLES